MVWNGISSRRSNVLSLNGAVATNDPIASEVGLALLKAGANAAEAAVGIAAVLNLVDSGSTGIGGDAFIMFYDAESKSVKGINGSGRSPEKLTLELLKDNGISLVNGHSNIPSSSGFSVTVPGAAAAWVDTIEVFGSGKFSLNDVLQPAIKLAEEGFPVHEFSAYYKKVHKDVLQQNEYSFGDDLLSDGRPPEHGEVMKNPKLANVFKTLAEKGKDGFYGNQSWISNSITKTVQAAGGCLTSDDMNNHSSTFDEPISTVYKGIKVYEMPPNGQGLIALMGLNIMEGLKINKDKERMSSSCFHKMIESLQLAFADGYRYIADPSKSHVPVDHLLSKSYSDERRKLIKTESIASSHYHQPTVSCGEDTVYFSVVDCYGNACSFINSIYNYNGSGLVPKDCGFILQSRGCNFSLDNNHSNCVAPKKRTYHTIIPAMATHASSNELFACFGVMGGFMQPQGHLQVISNLVDFGMTPQEALCYPRFKISHCQDGSTFVCVEDDISQNVIKKLRQCGHKIQVISGMNRDRFGRGQIIMLQKDRFGNRVLWSGSESRTDGCAMGY